MMNFVGSFFGSFATAGALSRTILQDTSGREHTGVMIVHVHLTATLYKY